MNWPKSKTLKAPSKSGGSRCEAAQIWGASTRTDVRGRSWEGISFQRGFLALGLSGLCLLASSFSLAAQVATNPASGDPPPETERFLLILDVSPAMQRNATNVLRIVNQLFTTEFDGQLHRGDTIGMWTYDDELHTGEYPLQRWRSQVSREIAAGTLHFIATRSYRKRARLAPLQKPLSDLVADSGRITVILFSDGSESLTGTPFDAQIAEAFKLNAAEQRRLAMPFVTILRAVKGGFVSVKINTPPWPIEFPSYPVEPTSTPPPGTNAPAPSKSVTHTADSEAPPPAANPTNPPVILLPTNPAATTTPTPPPPPTTEPSTNAAPIPEKAPPPALTNETPAAAAQTSPAGLPAISNQPPALETTGEKPERRFPLGPILVGAGIVLAGLTILSLALLKRSREAPRISLITRSMNKDRK